MRTSMLNAGFVSMLFVAAGFSAMAASGADSPERPRVIVLTDFFKDPDDKQSMIRFLSYANEFQVEGLIVTSLAFGDGSVRPDLLLEVLDLYGAVLPSLRTHERPGFSYPSAEALRQQVKAGAPVVRKLVGSSKGFPVPYPPGERDSRSCDEPEKWIGPGKDTPASEHLIRVVDADDARPVWVLVWGGSMDLAQALWKVRHDRSATDATKFVAKLRLYQISWQDTGAVWLWHEFPTLFRIQCSSAMRGIYMERRGGPGAEAWVNQHVRTGHGALGSAYSKAGATDGIKEGDTPTFLHLLARGLGDPERPEWGGWGGRFERLDPSRPLYVDARDRHPDTGDADRERRWTIGRWNDAICREFAARMDWHVQDHRKCNHPPLAVVDGDESHRVLERQARSGERLTLDASGSRDPEGTALLYGWWHYREAGTYPGVVTLQSVDSVQATLIAPQVNAPKSVHIILEVTDRGEPALTSYRRLIIHVRP